MKRSRPDSNTPTLSLGATELAATLNGDDPMAIHRTLGRFAKIVRRERRLALHSSDDDNDDNDAEETEDSTSESEVELEAPTLPENKKYKKTEEWKQDTAAYNVPFVGTSVAVKDTGVIVQGTWPTGLLRAYLTKSPRAVEFTSSVLIPVSSSAGESGASRLHKTLQRQKKGRLSRAIYKNYLRAVRELVTAAIPSQKLRRGSNESVADEEQPVDPAWLVFVRELVKHRLAGLLALLRDEVGHGKGKTGTKGGCGALAVMVLQILARLAQTSTETARSIVRAMEQQYHAAESIWRFLLRPKLPLDGTPTHREMARCAALELAATLATTMDTVILAAVATPGVRDRRISAGIFYIALKETCSLEINNNDDDDKEELDDIREDMVAAQAKVLEATRFLLTRSSNLKFAVSGVFTRDVVHAISKLAQNAPPLSENSPFESVLTQTDEYEASLLTDRNDAIEARRILFHLLSGGMDPRTSKVDTARQGFHIHETLVVKSLAQLVNTSSGLEVHRFVLRCLNESPRQLLPFAQNFVPGDPKDDISVLSNLNFVSKLVRHGPQPVIFRGNEAVSAEDICIQIVPLKKQTIAKAFQSTNSVILSQSIYVLLFALERLSKLRPTLPSKLADDLVARFATLIPDMQALTKLLERLQADSGRGSGYLTGCVHELLIQMCQTLPAAFEQSQIDPARLLPKDISSFGMLPVYAQCKVLHALRKVVSSTIHAKQSHLPALQLVLEITATTRRRRVYQEARQTAITLMRPCLKGTGTDNLEVNCCCLHETQCWIDGLKPEIIQEFCLKLYEVSILPLGGTLDFVRAWQGQAQEQSQEMAPTQFMSSVLVYLLKEYENVSKSLKTLAHKVAWKSLLFHADPRGIASTALYYVSDDDPAARSLKEYAKTVISPYADCEIEPISLLENSVRATFGDEWLVVRAEEAGLVSAAEDETEELMRLFSHCALVAGPRTKKGKRFTNLFRKCVILMVLQAKEVPAVLNRRDGSSAVRLLNEGSFVDLTLRISRRKIPDSNEIMDTDVFSSALQSTDWTRDRNCRETLSFGCLFCPLLPQREIVRRFLVLTRQLTKSNFIQTLGVVGEAARECARVMAIIKEPIAWTDENLKILWFCWKNLNAQKYGTVAYTVYTIMCCVLSDKSRTAAAIFELMGQINPEAVITRAGKLVSESGGQNSISEFLKQLCLGDPVQYAKAFTKNLLQGSNVNDRISGLVCQGFLDKIVLDILRLQSADQIRTELMTYALEESKSRFSEGHLIPETIELLHGLLSTQDYETMGEVEAQTIFACICQLCQIDVTSYELDPTMTVEAVGRTLKMCDRLNSNDQRNFHTILADLILFVISLVSRQIKQSKLSDPSRLESTIANASKIFCSVEHGFDMNQVIQSEITQTLVRRSLKLGLVSTLECRVAISSLDLLRSLVSMFGKARSPLEENGAYFSSMLIELTTSHSNFSALMTNQDATSFNQQYGVAKLVLCCMLSSNDCTIGKEELEILQMCSRGGMSRLDEIVRSIVVLFHQRSVEELYLDEMIWCDAPQSVRKDSVGHEFWDWLPSSIRQSRVFSTLRCFPIENMVHLSSASQMEQLMVVDAEEEKFRDDRYSPAFLFPLFLAALESMGDTTERETVQESPHLNSSTFEPKAVQFVRQMCDAGCLALSLSGMCSNSSDVRRLACAILFLISKVVHSETARQASSWRERPQLCLLLDSFQRALAIQRSDPDRNRNVDVSKQTVPWVNPLAAVFLARASMTLARPGDPLYPAINRYFLKVQGEHGAFPDLNRPPAFMSLFCNSTEEPKLAQQERLWTLEILRDSFLSESCWSPVKSCHAPELLLSTISMRLGTDDHDDDRAHSHSREIELLLSVLIRILLFGGPQARSFMLSRVGLLPWLGGILSSGRLRVLERNKGCAMLFLQLTRQTLKYALEMDDGINWSPALRSLPTSLCRIWNKAMTGSEVWSFVTEGLSMELISALLTETLVLAKNMLKKTHTEAIATPLANEILSKMTWRDDHHRMDSLVVLCSLPMSLGTPEEDVSLMKTVLDLTTSALSLNSAALTTILHRLTWLADHQSDLSTNDSIVNLLCRMRPLACRDAGTRKFWRSLYEDVVIDDSYSVEEESDQDAMAIESDRSMASASSQQ